MKRENGTLAAVRKAEPLKGRRNRLRVLGKTRLPQPPSAGWTRTTGAWAANRLPGGSGKGNGLPHRQGAGDEKLPYPPAGINRQALTDFIGTLWDMKK